jgi:hypothetical protein
VVTGLDEGVEYFFRLRAAGAGSCVGPNSATASVTTIVVTPAISFSASSASNQDETNAAFTVDIELAVAANASVGIESVGSATLDSDFSLSATQFVFTADGATTQTLTITPIDDTEFESPEEISLNLVDFSGADPGGVTNFTAALLDIEPTVSFSIGFDTVSEDADTYQFNVQKSYPVNDVSGEFLLGGSASNGVDYTISGTNFTLNGTTTSATFTVTLTDNEVAEFDRTIFLALTNISNAATGSTALVTIQDDGDGAAVNPGDLAIVGFHSDNPDDFLVVALTNLPGSTLIKFTDAGVSGGVLQDSESTVGWITPSGGVPAGQLVLFDSLGNVTTGQVDDVLSGLSSSGDQILAYQGDRLSPTFIYAVNFEDSDWQTTYANTADSELPPGLTNAVTAVALLETDNAVYAGTTSGDQATLLALIGDSANWTRSNTRGSISFPESNFTVTAPSPEIDVLGTNDASIASGTLTVSSARGTDFGTIALNETADRTFTITNIGSVALSVTDVTITGTHTSDFAVTASPGESVASRAATTFTVQFDPQAAGARSATVEISNSDADEGTYTFAIEGTATGPTATFGWASTNVSEDVGAITIPVQLGYAANASVGVRVASGSSAAAGSDFTLGTTQVVFTAGGATSQSVSLTILDDSVYEEEETVTLEFFNYVNASAGDTTSVSITIGFNDAMTPLAPGDLAIIGRSTAANSFSLLTLTNIAAGHIVYFTDSGWNDSLSEFRANEDLMRITFVNEVAAGTIIRTSDTSTNWTWTTSGDAPVSGSLSDLTLAGAGDQIYAFQVAYATNTIYESDRTFVYVLDDTGEFEDATSSNEGAVPPGLSVVSNTAVTLALSGNDVIGLNMDAVETNSFTKAGWLAFIADAANWTTAAAGIPSGSVPFGERPAALAAPTLSAASLVGSSSFRVNWVAVDGASSYRLDVSTNATFDGFVQGYESLRVTGTQHTVTGLTAETTHYYRMQTANPGGLSAYSTTGSVTTTTTAPSAPVALAADPVLTRSFGANWEVADGATGYRLDVATSDDFAVSSRVVNNHLISDGASTNYTVTGLTRETTYYYRVRAQNAGGTSGNSDVISLTTSNAPPPPKPDPVVPEAPVRDGDGVGLSLGNVSVAGADSYLLQVSTSPDFEAGTIVKQETVSNPAAAVAQFDTTGNRYYVRVVAIAEAGDTPSDPIALIRPTIPQGYSMQAPPVNITNLSFAVGGELGELLADVLTGGAVANNADQVIVRRNPWRTLWLNSNDNSWYENNEPTDLVLNPGEAYFILRRGAAVTADFLGQVGNGGSSATNALAQGYNLITVSRGQPVSITEAFEDNAVSGTPEGGGLRRNPGDRLILQRNGRFETIIRLDDGTWLNTATGQDFTDFELEPGAGFYYYRQGESNLEISF